jgi:ATP-dependent Lon protease
MGDIEEIESNILKDLNIISVKNITEVLKEALV